MDEEIKGLDERGRVERGVGEGRERVVKEIGEACLLLLCCVCWVDLTLQVFELLGGEGGERGRRGGGRGRGGEGGGVGGGGESEGEGVGDGCCCCDCGGGGGGQGEGGRGRRRRRG